MEQLVVSVSFRQKISSFCEREMPQVDNKNVEKIEVFVVFDAISVQFPREFIICFNAINNKRTRLASIFEEKVAAFCSKTTSE